MRHAVQTRNGDVVLAGFFFHRFDEFRNCPEARIQIDHQGIGHLKGLADHLEVVPAHGNLPQGLHGHKGRMVQQQGVAVGIGPHGGAQAFAGVGSGNVHHNHRLGQQLLVPDDFSQLAGGQVALAPGFVRDDQADFPVGICRRSRQSGPPNQEEPENAAQKRTDACAHADSVE